MSDLFPVFISEIWVEYQEACPHNKGVEDGTFKPMCDHPENDGTVPLDGGCKRCALLFCPDSEEVYSISQNRMHLREYKNATIDFDPPEGFESKPDLKLVVNN